MNSRLLIVLILLFLSSIAPGRPAEGKPREKERPPLTSIVLLQSEHRPMDVRTVREKFGKLFGRKFSEDPKDDSAIAQVKQDLIHIRLEGESFLLIQSDRAYFDPEQIQKLKDPRLRQAIENHKAWTSVDLYVDQEPADPDEAALRRKAAYQLIGPMLAELVDERCLGLYAPETRQLVEFHDQVTRKLRSDEPLSAMDRPEPRITPIPADHPLLLEAQKQAQAQWPQFAREFANRQPGSGFSVKLPFTEGDQTEHMWVNVQAIEGDKITGKLANKPVFIKKLKLDDIVHVEREKIEDWLYLKDGQIVGGFSMAAIKQIEQEKAGETTTRPSKF